MKSITIHFQAGSERVQLGRGSRRARAAANPRPSCHAAGLGPLHSGSRSARAWLPALLGAAVLLLLPGSVFGQFGLSGPTNVSTTVTIKADGSCESKSISISSRAAMENMVKMMGRIVDQSMDEDTPPTHPPVVDTKPLTDDELAAKIRELNGREFGPDEEDNATKIEVSFPTKDTVQTTETQPFASLQDMLGSRRPVFVAALEWIPLATLKIEKDADGHLRMTMSAGSYGREDTDARMLKIMRQQLKTTGLKSEARLVLPGKIISSGWPDVQDTATWFTLDAKDDKSIDAAFVLGQTNVVIVADLGGLKLDHPIDSKTARRATASKSGDLPITDAGPGFTAEAQSVMSTTVYQFPGAARKPGMAGMTGRYPGENGVMIQTKVFAPKGRTLFEASMPRVLTAVDDKDRSLVATNEMDESDWEQMGSYRSGGSERKDFQEVSLQVTLPKADAESIKEISAETIATTAGSWKEITLTNVVANTNQEIDLASILPGVKLIVQKIKMQGENNLSAQVELKGPPTIKQLDVNIKLPKANPEAGGSGANSNETRYSNKNGQAVRRLQLSAYSFGLPGQTATLSTNSVSLLISLPQDLKRERVKFKLSSLDLF